MMGTCHHDVRRDECFECNATPAQKAEYHRERLRRAGGRQRLAEARAAKLAGYRGSDEPNLPTRET